MKYKHILTAIAVISLILIACNAAGEGAQDQTGSRQEASSDQTGSGSVASQLDSQGQVSGGGSSLSSDDFAAAEFVELDGRSITIDRAGTFRFSGTISDGQLIVDAADEDTITLILDGVDITNSSSSAVQIENAGEVILYLAEGSENTVEDGMNYVLPPGEDEPNSAIYSRDDLIIEGPGSLMVVANYNNGISSNDDLRIRGGANISIEAVDDGIIGKNSLKIQDASIDITSGGDGVRSTLEGEGYIQISSSDLQISSGSEGIQAESLIEILSGSISIRTGIGGDGGHALKSGGSIAISGGDINIESRDDGMNADDVVSISGGSIAIQAADDAIKAEILLEILGGDIDITGSYEGLEAQSIQIQGGTIRLVSSDDGVNATRTDGAGAATPIISVTGGTLYVFASGDGLDANGNIDISGGTIFIDGPSGRGNGSLDYDRSFSFDGGTIIAVDSGGMMGLPDSGNAGGIVYGFQSAGTTGDVVELRDAQGTVIASLTATKTFQVAIILSPEIEIGSEYTLSGPDGEVSIVSDNKIYQAGNTAAMGRFGRHR